MNGGWDCKNCLQSYYVIMIERTRKYRTSLYAFLRDQYGVHFGGASKSIQIAEPTEVEAELLGIPLSTPMMMIREIVYSSTDEPLHRTKQYLLGDRFKYVIPKK